MLNDGYGDDASIPEVVSRFRKWSHTIAGDYTAPSGMVYDDLVQEALIAIWRSLEKKGGKANVSATYLTQVARYRMQKVVTGKQMYGGDPKPGPRSRPQTYGVDWEEAEDAGDPITRLLEAADVLSAVEWAYHHGEIAKALGALPAAHQEYVVERFWRGKTDTEIAEERGVSNKLIGQWWRRSIRPRLRHELAHLART